MNAAHGKKLLYHIFFQRREDKPKIRSNSCFYFCVCLVFTDVKAKKKKGKVYLCMGVLFTVEVFLCLLLVWVFSPLTVFRISILKQTSEEIARHLDDDGKTLFLAPRDSEKEEKEKRSQHTKLHRHQELETITHLCKGKHQLKESIKEKPSFSSLNNVNIALKNRRQLVDFIRGHIILHWSNNYVTAVKTGS